MNYSMTSSMNEHAISKQEARTITDQIRGRIADVVALVTQAYQSRIWEPLGYATWDEYVKGELGDAPLRLPTADRLPALVEMRQAGMPLRAIGAAVGLSKNTIGREIERVSTVPNGTVDNPWWAVTSLDGRVRPSRTLTEEELLARRHRVLELNAAGRTQLEIAAAEGVSQATVSMDLQWVRELQDSVPEELRAGIDAEVTAEPRLTLALAREMSQQMPQRRFVPGLVGALEQLDTAVQFIESTILQDQWVNLDADQRKATNEILTRSGRSLHLLVKTIALIDLTTLADPNALEAFWGEFEGLLDQAESIPRGL